LRECWYLIAILVMLLLKRNFEFPFEEILWLSLSSILLIIHLVNTSKDAFWNSHRFYQVLWMISFMATYATFYLAEFNKEGLEISQAIALTALIVTGLGLHFKDSDPQQASLAYIYLHGLAFYLV
jgi:hypothetical protein